MKLALTEFTDELAEMRENVANSEHDPESAHGDADELLVRILERLNSQLQFTQLWRVIEEYKNVKKWYA